MDNTQVVILAIASFIAGFLTCKTWFATNIAEYFIYKSGFIQRVGETPPDETYPDLRYVDPLDDFRRHPWFDEEDYIKNAD